MFIDLGKVRYALETKYDPDRLLNELIQKLELKNDAALAHALEVSPAVIRNIRHGKTPVSPDLLIRAHEVSNISIRQLKLWVNIPYLALMV